MWTPQKRLGRGPHEMQGHATSSREAQISGEYEGGWSRLNFHFEFVQGMIVGDQGKEHSYTGQRTDARDVKARVFKCLKQVLTV